LTRLPAGIYAGGFELASFQPSKREDISLNVGATTEVNTTMALAGRVESVTVTAAAPPPVATVAVSQAYTKREVDLLPVGRRPQDIAEPAPGLTNVTPNASQVTIAGRPGSRTGRTSASRRRTISSRILSPAPTAAVCSGWRSVCGSDGALGSRAIVSYEPKPVESRDLDRHPFVTFCTRIHSSHV
jgi:hypothetical protein